MDGTWESALRTLLRNVGTNFKEHDLEKRKLYMGTYEPNMGIWDIN